MWLAIIHPETLGGGGGAFASSALSAARALTYGEGFVSATWIDAGPQGMNCARERSRIRMRDLWTCAPIPSSASQRALEGGKGRTSFGSRSSPWMMFIVLM